MPYYKFAEKCSYLDQLFCQLCLGIQFCMISSARFILFFYLSLRTLSKGASALSSVHSKISIQGSSA